jgi:thiol:disulfide interchange protein/DsbC/DsbD-like thiol-disulfide interchange protein
MVRITAFHLLPALALASVSAAHALESAPITTPHAEVRLASEVDAFEPGKPFRLGLHFKLAEGWHIYWSNPGSAGQPPEVDFVLPEGAKASEIVWPTPLRVPEGPAMTYSYLDEALLPVTLTTPAGLSALPIRAKASWLICEKICVPEEGELRLDLPAGAPEPSAEAPLFAAADARIPISSPYAATVSTEGVLSLTGHDGSLALVRDASFLPAAWGEIDDLAPQTSSYADGKLSLALKPGQTFDPSQGLAGVVVLKDAAGRQRFLTIAATPEGGSATPAGVPAPQPAKSAAPAPAADPGVIATLAFAFLGGLILNLMPCVFPILAMKAVGVARLAGHARGVVRAHALSYTLGVLVAFAALAGLLLAMRAAGVAAGWGFQFQSPAFVAGMAWLLFGVGLNLSGVFEFNLGFTGAGAGLTRLHGHAGSFFTGLLAVLVATPCTAPFMGAAIAAAATAPVALVMLIFLVMGLGLAAPYAIFALAPGVATLLPRPGRWMLVLRQALAFPMYGAAVWLVWVVSQEAGADGVLAALSGALLIGFAAWLLSATRDTETWRALGRMGAATTAIGALALLFNVAATPTSTADGEGAYSESRLASLRAEGRPVFVDMTAAWCVTCLVNERIALSSDAVKQAFAGHKVAYLKGDWTHADPAISQFLREHGRDGVPLYVFYPPKGKPVVLPQILTESAVLDQIDRAGS